ncbi:dTMP kinase [Aureibacillus halotolerans]|uniref:Thymidylate kinase n=1 Tax=Aureibacillus halotolerans TaxID=1508390 RepID=A0A4R6TQR7_9BACI|nr:dTMP kinase [Aureibacillus halotolerans]TDQ34252.1 dTMP kinase [Aureibacillus halotolerans]
MKGFFLTFEGPDGSGKSTQLQLLHTLLAEMGIESIVTREPGGTAIGDAVRGILLDPAYGEMKMETEILLYAASRAQHVHEVIMPALNEGKVVLCDRFVDASVAYQGSGLPGDLDAILSINRFATRQLVPDRTYMMMVSAEEGRGRLNARAGIHLDRIEARDLAYHQRVYEAFQRIAEKDASRVLKVDATKSIDEIHTNVKTDFLTYYHSIR